MGESLDTRTRVAELYAEKPLGWFESEREEAGVRGSMRCRERERARKGRYTLLHRQRLTIQEEPDELRTMQSLAQELKVVRGNGWDGEGE